MSQQAYVITFEGTSPAEANRYTSELRDVLLDVSPDIQVERRRDNPHTQDFGTTLVLILGTSSATVIARAIGDWLKLRNSASLTIETTDGRMHIQNITSKDAARLADLLSPNK